MLKALIVLLYLFDPSVGNAAEPSGEKAVLEYSSETGIKLSVLALKTIGVETAMVSSESVFNLPETAQVLFQDKKGVYRLRDGWFKLVEIEGVRKLDSRLTFKCTELRSGDAVAIRGVALLRVSELEASGGGE